MSFNPKPVTFPSKVTGKLRIGNTAADYGVYSTGTVQKFELGTRYQEGDNVYRYAKAGAALNPKFGAFNYNQFFAENTSAAAVIGQMYVVITTDATSGHVTTGFGTKNNMVGGYFSQPDTAHAQFRRIVGHDAGPSGTVLKVYLDGPITRTMVTNSFSEWFMSPYADVRNNAGNMGSVVGLPTVIIASGSYGWLKTWGPHWVNSGIVGLGSGSNDRMVVFDGAGAIRQTSDFTWGETDAHQIAGFLLERTQSGNWTNPPLTFLQINP